MKTTTVGINNSQGDIATRKQLTIKVGTLNVYFFQSMHERNSRFGFRVGFKEEDNRFSCFVFVMLARGVLLLRVIS